MVQDTLFRLITRAGFAARKEQATPECTRPGDVFVGRLETNGPAAIDITVRHPLAPSRPVRTAGEVDRWRVAQEQDKVVKYRGICGMFGWSLIPFVADCYDGLGGEARSLVSMCLRHLLAQKEPGARRGAEADAWQSILLPLAKEVARQLRSSLFATSGSGNVADQDEAAGYCHSPYSVPPC